MSLPLLKLKRRASPGKRQGPRIRERFPPLLRWGSFHYVGDEIWRSVASQGRKNNPPEKARKTPGLKPLAKVRIFVIEELFSHTMAFKAG